MNPLTKGILKTSNAISGLHSRSTKTKYLGFTFKLCFQKEPVRSRYGVLLDRKQRKEGVFEGESKGRAHLDDEIINAAFTS